MSVNEKEYKSVERTIEENEKFLRFLRSAYNNLKQAVDTIKYPSFKTLNEITQNDITNIIETILDIEDLVSNEYMVLYKPEKEK